MRYSVSNQICNLRHYNEFFSQKHLLNKWLCSQYFNYYVLNWDSKNKFILEIDICNGLTIDIQTQPSRDILRERCSENMQQIYRKTPMTKCDFNKVGLQFKYVLKILRTVLLNPLYWIVTKAFLSVDKTNMPMSFK